MWRRPFESTLARRHSAPRLRELNMTPEAAVGFPRPLNMITFVLTFELVHGNGTVGFILPQNTLFNHHKC